MPDGVEDQRFKVRNNLARRIAIVTGVSRLAGIGRAICLELAKRDVDIFFTFWTKYDEQMPWKVGKDEPTLIKREVEDCGVSCKNIELDLSVEDSVKTLFNEAQSKLGNPSILINNATYSTQTDIDNFSAAELDKHYQVNLKAVTLLTIEFVRRFKAGKNGRIINLVSGQSLGEMSDEIAYAITKGAVETLTQTISQKIATKGITINAVNPGPNDTGWIDDNLREELLKRFPMKRIGQPADIANLIGFLTSEEAEWITGQIIHSEGGFIR